MEPIIEKVRYPSAPLQPCLQPPIETGEKTALLAQLAVSPTFQGAWTINERGLPVVILQALNSRNFHAARTSMTGVLAWLWPHGFGRLVSFSLVVPGERGMPRAFFADDAAIVRVLAEKGQIALAVAHGKKTTPFYLADFNAHLEHPDMLDAFRALCRFEDNRHFLFRDDELAFWLLMADRSQHWHAELQTKDRTRAVWATVYEQHIRLLERDFVQARKKCGVDPYANEDARTHIPVVMPFLDQIARLVIEPSTTVAGVIDAVSTVLEEPQKVGELVTGIFAAAKNGAFPEEMHCCVWDALLAALVSSRSTNCGLRRPWLDARNGSGNVAVRYLDLALTALGEGAPEYWTAFDEHELFDIGYVVTGRDRPIERKGLFRELAAFRLDCTQDEAIRAIEELLVEARDGRQWSVPWGARVQVDVGPLKYLDIHELEGEFMVVFRNADEQFLVLALNVTTGNYSVPTILRAEEGAVRGEHNIEAQLTLALVAAAVVRDFLVVEERHSLFDAKRTTRLGPTINRELSITYLPRVRYTRPKVKRFLDDTGKEGGRAAHSVAGHLRRAETVTDVQRLLAMRYGFTVPRGYTFVRPHRRGTLEEARRTHVYRSRSASRMLYEEMAAAPRGTRPAWFDFEKDVAQVMSSLGLTVVHQAASRSGDGGVDIYAHDETMDKIWAIQCKCYAPSRKVGPGVVRELAGSLQRYPAGTKGMIVTTSAFTSGATREAEALNFEVIDGHQFAALRMVRSSAGQCD